MGNHVSSANDDSMTEKSFRTMGRSGYKKKESSVGANQGRH